MMADSVEGGAAVVLNGGLALLGVALLAMRARAASRIRMVMSLGALPPLLWSLFMDCAVNAFALALLWLTISHPGWATVAPGLISLVILFPYPFARAVLVPLGASEAACLMACMSHRSFWHDRVGGGVGAGARALLRRCSRPERAAFLERHLAESSALDDSDIPSPPGWLRPLFFFVPEPSPANALLGTGLLCAARGDADGAREVLERIETLAPHPAATEARRLAIEWRCADAAERGDWTLIVCLGTDESLPRTPVTRFLAAVALRLLADARAPDDEALLAAWRRSGRRKNTEPLLARALGSADRGPASRTPARNGPSGSEEALRCALGAHLAVSDRTPERPAVALRGLASLWDRVLADSAMRESLSRRARDLGVPGAVAVLDDLELQVEQQLASLVRRDRIPLCELQCALGRLAKVGRSLRDELVGQLEQATGALRRRVEEDRRLPGAVELSEFHAIQGTYRQIAEFGGMEQRRLAFSIAHAPVCGLAVWLWNERRQRRVANEIFRFLLIEAVVLDEPSAFYLQARNVRAGA